MTKSSTRILFSHENRTIYNTNNKNITWYVSTHKEHNTSHVYSTTWIIEVVKGKTIWRIKEDLKWTGSYQIRNTGPIRIYQSDKRDNFPSKLIENGKHISKPLTYFEERIENISVDSKTKVAKFEPKKTIEKKLDDTKADHMKKIYSLDMKISAIK